MSVDEGFERIIKMIRIMKKMKGELINDEQQ